MSQTFIPVTNSNGSFLAIDWFTQGPAIQQDEVRNDKDIDFAIQPALLNPANSETPYTSDFETGDQFQMAIGNFDASPTTGTVSLQVGATTSGLTAIPATVTASALQTALNAALTTEAKPLCTVTLLASGNYQLTGVTNGAISTGFFTVVNDALLYPVSDAFFVEGSLGSATSVYQLLFVMRQAPMCYAEATVETADADVAIETVQVGDATHNKIQRISFNIPQVFSGGYTINATANSVVATCGVGTPLMTATHLGLVLAQHPEIKFSAQNGDPDNVKVTVVGQSWVVEFIGTLANDDTNELTVMNNPDGPLMGAKGCTGSIDYNTFGLYVYSLTQSQNTFDLTRSITRTRASGERRTLYSGPVTIFKDLIDAQTAIPTPMPSYYTTTQADARFVKMVPGTSTMQSGSIQEFGSGSELVLDGDVSGSPTSANVGGNWDFTGTASASNQSGLAGSDSQLLTKNNDDHEWVWQTAFRRRVITSGSAGYYSNGASSCSNFNGIGLMQLSTTANTSAKMTLSVALQDSYQFGISFNNHFQIALCGRVDLNSDTTKKARFLVGPGYSSSPAMSNANALSATGIGCEILYTSGQYRIYVVLYNGSFSTSSGYGVLSAPNGNLALILENVGDGTVNLYAGSASNAVPSVSPSPVVTMTGGPTGTAGFGAGIEWSVSNDSVSAGSSSAEVEFRGGAILLDA